MNKKFLFSFLMLFSFAITSFGEGDPCLISSNFSCGELIKKIVGIPTVPANKVSLLEAAKEQDLVTMEILIDTYFYIFRRPVHYFYNPLDEQDEMGRTSLHYAVLKQNAEMFNLLIKNGASLDIKDKENQFPLDLALTTKNATMIDLTGRAMTQILLKEAEATEYWKSWLKVWAVVGGLAGVLGLMQNW